MDRGWEFGVLEGLEAVDWAALGQAYGSAEDVPAWLRALRSPDPEVRQWGHEDWNIVHRQGTRYSATAPAVPFLVELATAPDTHDRAWLVNLLAYAAVGNEEAVLPDGVVSLDRLGDTTSWPEPEYAAWALAAYQAVQAALPALLPLLEEDDDRVRRETAHCWPGSRPLRRLACPACARLPLEAERDTRVTMIVAIGLLAGATGQTSDSSWLSRSCWPDPIGSCAIGSPPGSGCTTSRRGWLSARPPRAASWPWRAPDRWVRPAQHD
jgi:hypothetical protein